MAGVFGFGTGANTARTNAVASISFGNIMPMGLTNLFTKSSDTKYLITKTILDLMFRDCCVWMSNPELVFTKEKINNKLGTGLSSASDFISQTGFPLLGFQFQQPKKVELLKYSYSEYPFLNRNVVVNAMQKEMTSITLTGLRPIVPGNPVLLNYVINMLGLKLYIEKYCDYGGTWSINTMWGVRSNYVLTDLNGVNVSNEGGLGGVGWEFTFKRLNMDATTMSESVSKSNNSVSVLECI